MLLLQFLIDTLAGLAALVCLLRLLLQLSRADFRNPVARSLLQLSDPLVLPLRRLVPPLGRVDSASALAVLLVLAAKLLLLQWLGAGPTASALPLLLLLLQDAVQLVLHTYLWGIMLHALLSMLAPDSHSPAQSLLYSLCEPILRPIRQRIPALNGLDLSPLWAVLVIQALLLLVR